MKPEPFPGASTSSEPGSGRGRTGRVCVVGSVNEDIVITVAALPTAGQTVPGKTMSVLPGGKGANQAVAAARAGAPVLFVGAVGADDAGRRSVAALQEEGVDSSAVLVDDTEPTGTAVVTVADDGENQITVVAGANNALTGDHVTRAMGRLGVGPSDVCLICFEITDEALVAAAQYAREHGVVLLVNPAPARPLAEKLRAAEPILLPNASEAEAIAGVKGDAAAVRLHEMSGAAVVVTLGARGVRIVGSSPTYTLPALTVNVVDTTGAGDTFAGVLSAMLAQGAGLRSAARSAVVAAGLSVTVRGAREGSPRAGRIVEALRTVN